MRRLTKRSSARALLMAILVMLVLAPVGAAAGPASGGSSSGLLPVAVSPCSVRSGVDSPAPATPTKLLAQVTPRDAARLEFFSDGQQTVLAPRGWSCQALVAADGSQALEAYPAGSAAADSLPDPTKPSQSVYVASDYTGHGPGAQLVCALFPHGAAAAFLDESSLPCPALPAGTTTTRATPDVVMFSEPSGRRGIAVEPDVPSASDDGVTVGLGSCRITGAHASLCGAILGDDAVRNAPAVDPQR